MTPLVSAEALAAGYNGAPVLTGVTFAVEPGQRVAVLGPNGGGKTTLFRVLLGELEAGGGSVDRPARAGLVPQTERSRLDFPVSALDVALMGAVTRLAWWRRPSRADRAKAREALASVGLAEQAHTTFGDLSGGQRQRVLVARALVQDAPVVLLDEPFTGLDSTAAQRLEGVLDGLAAEGRALLIATHDVEQARRWDRVLCLNRRQIAYGAPDDVLSPETLAATYGSDLVRLPGDGERLILPPHHCDH